MNSRAMAAKTRYRYNWLRAAVRDRQMDGRQIQIDRQIDRQIDIQTDRQTDRQIDRQIDRQMIGWMDGQIDSCTYRQQSNGRNQKLDKRWQRDSAQTAFYRDK